MDPKTLLFFGMSGSGKGTLAKLIKEYLEKNDSNRKVITIETGALLREFAKGNGHTQDLSRKVLGEGGLFPAFLPIHAWGEFLINNFTGSEHLILDGLARRVSEAPVFDNALRFYGREKIDVVVLETDREVAADRLRKRGRADDIDEEDIQARLDWYEENTKPVLKILRDFGHNIHMINGNQTIEEVGKETELSLGLI